MYNHLMSNGVGCLAIIIYLIIISPIFFFSNLPRIKHMLFSVPDRTTGVFVVWFIFTPSFMLFVSLLVIILQKVLPPDVDVMWVLPLLLERFILIFYNHFVKKSEIRDKEKLLDKESKEFRKLIKGERRFIRNVSFFSLIIAYIIIAFVQMFDLQLEGVILYIFLYSIASIVALRCYTSSQVKKNNAPPSS